MKITPLKNRQTFCQFCRSSNRKTSKHNREAVNSVVEPIDIYRLEKAGDQKTRKLCIDLETPCKSKKGFHTISAFVDTSATVNVISRRSLANPESQRWSRPEINTSKRQHWRCTTQIDKNTRCDHDSSAMQAELQKLDFQMVDREVETILSAKTCLDLKLISTAHEVQYVNPVKESKTDRLTSLKQQQYTCCNSYQTSQIWRNLFSLK